MGKETRLFLAIGKSARLKKAGFLVLYRTKIKETRFLTLCRAMQT